MNAALAFSEGFSGGEIKDAFCSVQRTEHLDLERGNAGGNLNLEALVISLDSVRTLHGLHGHICCTRLDQLEIDTVFNLEIHGTANRVRAAMEDHIDNLGIAFVKLDIRLEEIEGFHADVCLIERKVLLPKASFRR